MKKIRNQVIKANALENIILSFTIYNTICKTQ